MIKKLNDNTLQFRKSTRNLGFNILGSEGCPIVPVLLMEEKLPTELGEKMLNDFFLV